VVGDGEVDVANSPANVSPSEARRAIRVRTFLQARISYGEGAISTECTVSQLSDSGARLTVASTVALPDVFDIAVPQRGISRRAKLVWRNDDQVGVDFFGGDEDPSALAGDDHSARIKALEAENARLKAQVSALLQQVHRLTEE
jgi:PilZ domain